jgi:hypothetical protein
MYLVNFKFLYSLIFYSKMMTSEDSTEVIDYDFQDDTLKNSQVRKLYFLVIFSLNIHTYIYIYIYLIFNIHFLISEGNMICDII